MTRGKRTDERPTRELAQIVFEQFGVSIFEALEGWRGEESIGWRGTSTDGDRFVQRIAKSREVGELMWSNSVATAASTEATEAISALASPDGSTAITTPDGPVMVFPFVEGSHDPYDGIASDAAMVLARLHRGIATSWTDQHPRPRRGSARASREDLLPDDDLDGWERSATASGTLPVHGDYYGGNLLSAGGRIRGVVDWFDAKIAPHEQEVAWAVWEFCQNEDAEDLVDEEAEAFLQSYLETGGTAHVARPFDPCPWIRVRLRAEARAWFADVRSESERSDYHEAQLVAFERLRGRRLPGR